MLPVMRRAPPLSAGRPGFTLLEFLIAIGILGVLASVVIAAVSPRKAILAAATRSGRCTPMRFRKG
jgi:prepilin-type N-terminal cleavage/methylation domain-containing protein